MNMNWSTAVTKRLGVRYPIIQAPMFGVTTPAMVAAACKAGVLGSLPLGDLSAARSAELIRMVKELTGGTFAVNLFVHTVPPITEELRARYVQMSEFLARFAFDNGLKVTLPGIDEIDLFDYHEQLDIVLGSGVRIVSFTFGNLDASAIERFKEAGVILIGTCTSVAESIALEKAGIDLICVQGLEAGGHRGSFLSDDIPLIGGFSLLAQVCDTVRVPVIYAGGIYNGRSLLAARQLGAAGFQTGSLLLVSQESALKDFEKQRLLSVTEKDIILTRTFSGRFARGMRNSFTHAVDESGLALPYPYQNKITGELRRAARAAGNASLVNLWVGQSAYGFDMTSATDIIHALITDTEKTFHEL